MKLTTILLIGTFLQVSAASFAQNITYTHKSASLEQIFKVIRKQTGYNVLWASDKLKNLPAQDVDFKDTPIGEVLDKVLSGKPLTYQIDKKTILIKERLTLTAPLPIGKPSAALIDVHGQVTNESAQPLSGATVQDKTGKKTVITNAQGYFTLKAVTGNTIVVITFIGYQKLEISAAEELGVIRLKEATNQLDAVQVQAYGMTSKRLATGDISTVSAKAIQSQPVGNPLLALQGQVAGLLVTQNSGVPGGGVTIQIQGQNSLNKGNDPLYVIDGVPYFAELPASLGAGIFGYQGVTLPGVGSPLNFINPSDIESISILKDADATAIYGSRAANGAILITTKKGAAGKTKVDLNAQDGWGKVAHMLPLMNTQQYLQMRHQAFRNDGLTPGPTDFDINGSWDTTRNTNWQKALIGGTAHYTDVQASVSGGNENTTFLVGTGYHRESSVFPGSLADRKASVHFNVNNVSTNKKFVFQLSGNYLADDNELIYQDLTNKAITIAPDAPALYNADGSLNWQPVNGNSTWVNPLAFLAQTYSNRTNNLIGNALVSYNLFNGFTIISTFGYTNYQSDEIVVSPLTYYAPDARSLYQRSTLFENSNNHSWIIEPQLSYQKNLFGGIIDALAGTTFTQQNATVRQLYASGFNSDLVMTDIASAPTVIPALSNATTYRYTALFGRINYNWASKYILNVTTRRDGSSRFGEDNLFHDFWSVAGAWIFSNEKFVSSSLPFLSFGKLRSSYGTTGNDQIGDYQFLSTYSSIPVGTAYQGGTALAPTGLTNPHLQWEETRKLQIGLDLGFLKDRIALNVTYYRNRSSNELLPYSLPVTTGFTQIFENFPAVVQNTGFEISANSAIIKTTDFSWNSGFNITLPRNKLISFPGLATSTVASAYVIGQPVSIQKTFNYKGVDPNTGLYTFIDQSGNPTTNPSFITDYNGFVNTGKALYGGFQNNFRYKRFELDFLFSFVRQKAVDYSLGIGPGQFYSDNQFNSAYGNQPTYVLGAWQKTGDQTTVQKYSTQYSPTTLYAQLSDRGISDASYIRLKNLSFSWQLPPKWNSALGLQNCRIYAQGQNLLTFTKYKGLDPETLSMSSLPPLKVLTLGLQVDL